MKNIQKLFKSFTYLKSHKLLKLQCYHFCNIKQQQNKSTKKQQEIRINIFEEIQNLSCKGCGISLQIEEVFEEGYIDQKHLKKYLIQREKKKFPDKIIQEQLNNYLESFVSNNSKSQTIEHSQTAQNIQIDQDTDIEKLQAQTNAYEQIWSREKIDTINCLRCLKLKQNNLREVLQLNKNQKQITKKELIGSIFNKIGTQQVAILVMDVNDINGSYPEQIVEQINKKQLKYLVIINKIDTISSKINQDLLKRNIYQNLQDKNIKLNNLSQQQIVFVSSKTGDGIKTLINKLRDLSKQQKQEKIQRRLYVIGSINTGKSSFLNALMKECQKQKKNIYYKDPFDEDYKQMLKTIKTSLELQEDEKTVLVQSFVPGSTQRTVKIQVPKIGFSCYDTPGILNDNQPFNFVSDLKTIQKLSFQKQTEPTEIILKQNSSIWFGALIRFDNLSVNQQAQCFQNYRFFA